MPPDPLVLAFLCILHYKMWPDHMQIASSGPGLYASLTLIIIVFSISTQMLFRPMLLIVFAILSANQVHMTLMCVNVGKILGPRVPMQDWSELDFSVHNVIIRIPGSHAPPTSPSPACMLSCMASTHIGSYFIACELHHGSHKHTLTQHYQQQLASLTGHSHAVFQLSQHDCNTYKLRTRLQSAICTHSKIVSSTQVGGFDQNSDRSDLNCSHQA